MSAAGVRGAQAVGRYIDRSDATLSWSSKRPKQAAQQLRQPSESEEYDGIRRTEFNHKSPNGTAKTSGKRTQVSDYILTSKDVREFRGDARHSVLTSVYTVANGQHSEEIKATTQLQPDERKSGKTFGTTLHTVHQKILVVGFGASMIVGPSLFAINCWAVPQSGLSSCSTQSRTRLVFTLTLARRKQSRLPEP